MLKRLPEEGHDVLVVEGVEDDAAIAARPHQAHAAKQAQLVGDGGLADPQHRRQVAHAQLAVRQGIENPHARGVPERAEGVGQPRYRVWRHQRRADLADTGEIDLNKVANLIIYEHMSSCSYIITGPRQLQAPPTLELVNS